MALAPRSLDGDGFYVHPLCRVLSLIPTRTSVPCILICINYFIISVIVPLLPVSFSFAREGMHFGRALGEIFFSRVL